MMQFIPDFGCDFYDKISFEKDFKVPFEGPGLYLTKNDTILVYCPEDDLLTIWYKTQPEDKFYTVMVWNCPWNKTIFSVLSFAPVRLDTRHD